METTLYPNDRAAKGPIAQRYDTDHTTRHSILEESRACAALSKPWLLPPEGQQPDEKLPESYQDMGKRGVSNLEGRMLMALFPPGTPWFHFDLDPQIEFDPRLDPREVQAIKQALFIREVMMQSVLESSNSRNRSRGRVSNFRSNKRMSLSQLLVTGDTLEHLDDDYRLRVFRRDQYVTRRDSAGDVLYHIVREEKDPFALTDEQFAKSGLDREKLAREPVDRRMVGLYTLVEWNPQSKVWVIEQEVNGRTIVRSEETVSPYFSTPFELVPGESYGRGFIERHKGSLKSLEELTKRGLDFAAMCSWMKPCIDYGSEVREEDLMEESGRVMYARVAAGVVQDVALFKVDKAGDFGVAHAMLTHVEQNLSRDMLIESEVTPTGDRVTRAQVNRVALELEGALGGIYAPIAENQQDPLIHRVEWQMTRDRMLRPLPGNAVRIRTVTGIEALARANDAAKLASLSEVIQTFGPEALAKIDVGVLIDVLARYQGIDEPGLVKSNEQVARERQQAIAAQTQLAAAQKTIDVAGNVAEHAATQQTGAQ